MVEFKIGDSVRIKITSKYAYQSDGIGVIIGIADYDTGLPYHVKFDDGNSNSYGNKDLELVSDNPELETALDLALKR